MSFQTMNEKIEKHILPIANKLSSQRHLRAIRDAFISLLPITLMGGVTAVIGAAPVTEETTNGFLLAWASFAQDNSMLLNWISALTLGGMSIYVCIAITYYLTRHFKHDFLVPVMLSVCGFLMLVMTPQQLGWDGDVYKRQVICRYHTCCMLCDGSSRKLYWLNSFCWRSCFKFNQWCCKLWNCIFGCRSCNVSYRICQR